jgi:hypothetical protein
MLRVWIGVLLVVIAVGCKSKPLGPYVSPRVTGQVVRGDNQQPVPGVLVTRGRQSQKARLDQTAKGGEMLMQKIPTRTDGDGAFVLPSERVLSVFRGSGWNVVTLSFSLPGYLSLQTNCPIKTATQSARGEPVLDVGRIQLTPVTP